MTTTTRFLTGGIATLAVASAVTLAAPAANATASTCGQPAVPASYVTVFHDPVLREVPAVTHDEWRWQRDVTTYENEYSKVVTPAHTESDWAREVPGTTEYLWSRTVIDQPAVPGTPEQGHHETVVVTPAVTVTLFEYVQQQTGKTRWEHDGWNGEHADEDDGKGWFKTGNTREDVVTPAVTEDLYVVDQAAVPATDEVSHVDNQWAATSPGADWEGPLDTRAVGGSTETTTTSDDDVPAGDGWVRTATHTFPAVVDTLWALAAPDGYDPTGATRVHEVTTEETDGTSATAPDGDGWTQVADSRLVVVDQPATTEVVGEGWSEQVLVSPAQAATAPCPAAPTGGSVVAGPSGGSQAAPAAVAHSATVLPATGNPVSALLVSAGVGALIAGSVLVRSGRRRRTT